MWWTTMNGGRAVLAASSLSLRARWSVQGRPGFFLLPSLTWYTSLSFCCFLVWADGHGIVTAWSLSSYWSTAGFYWWKQVTQKSSQCVTHLFPDAKRFFFPLSYDITFNKKKHYFKSILLILACNYVCCCCCGRSLYLSQRLAKAFWSSWTMTAYSLANSLPWRCLTPWTYDSRAPWITESRSFSLWCSSNHLE